MIPACPSLESKNMNTLSSPSPAAVPHETDAAEPRGWFATLDPARIAGRFAGLAFAFALLASLAGLALRVELLTPALDSVTPRTFGALLSLHGTLMMYFVALPLFPGVLGHALLPSLLGGRAFVFPRLMRAAWHLLALGGALVAGGFVLGGTEAGWMFDTLFGGRFTSSGILTAAIGVLLAATSLGLMSLNMATTLMLHRRATGAALPPLASALMWSSLLGLVACPILAICTATVIADRVFDLAVFLPAGGGSPDLFAAIFRRFSIPAQNMILLGGLGTVAQVIVSRTGATRANASFSRLFGAIAVAGLIAWGGAGAPAAAEGGIAWATLPFTVLIATCAGLAILLCVLALRRGFERLDTPLVYALAFLATLAGALVTGLLLAMPVLQQHLGNTVFSTAHLHLTMTALLGLAFMAGLHDVWPRLTGRAFSEVAGKAAAVVILISLHLVSLPLYSAGRSGAPFRSNAYAEEFTIPHVMAFAGTSLLLAGLAVAVINLIAARRPAQS